MRFLARWPRLAERRLDRAEQRLYDAYGRGGLRARKPLVVPIDYLRDTGVRQTLIDWLTRRAALDIDALLDAWDPDASHERRAGFYENLVCLLAILHDDAFYAPSWPGIRSIYSDGRPNP